MTRTEQALRAAGYREPVLPPANPEHVQALTREAAANAALHGPHGTQPATVTPPRGKHSALLGCLVLAAFCSPWFVGVACITAYLWSKLP